MGCKHDYSKIDIDFDRTGNGTDVKGMAKAGNKAIKGLVGKCVAVKRKGCR